VIDIAVWVDGVDHECCGETRRIGDRVGVDLMFYGDLAPAADPDQVEVLDGGRVSIVGTVVGPVGEKGQHTEGTLIASGAMRFGVRADPPAARVRCVGQLSESHHGFPSGVTNGEVVGIRWRLAIQRRLDGGLVVTDGYELGDELRSTDDRPELPGSEGWAFELTFRIEP
jgi:hypothetical protein